MEAAMLSHLTSKEMMASVESSLLKLVQALLTWLLFGLANRLLKVEFIGSDIVLRIATDGGRSPLNYMFWLHPFLRGPLL
jgi:hypothetical protein